MSISACVSIPHKWSASFYVGIGSEPRYYFRPKRVRWMFKVDLELNFSLGWLCGHVFFTVPDPKYIGWAFPRTGSTEEVAWGCRRTAIGWLLRRHPRPDHDDPKRVRNT